MAIFVIENRIASNPVGSPSLTAFSKSNRGTDLFDGKFNMPSERISLSDKYGAYSLCDEGGNGSSHNTHMEYDNE